MIPFLLKSTLLMALLLAVYQLFLGHEKMHRFSRYYLMAALLFSLVAPFITFETRQTVIPTLSTVVADQPAAVAADAMPVMTAATPADVAGASEGFGWQKLLFTIYLTISGALLIRFALNLTRILRSARIGERKPHAEATLVLVDETIPPFSFLRFIFVSASDYWQGHIAPELLTHELTHVRQRHTIDVLLVELLQVVLWFNPLVYLYKRAIRINHEFLADERVIEHHQNAKHYQHLLLDTIFRKNTPQMASSINYLLTKKRLTMMNRKTSKRRSRVLQMAIVPLMAFVVFVFCVRSSEPVMAQDKSIAKVNTGIKAMEISSDTLEMVKDLYFKDQSFTIKTPNKVYKGKYRDMPKAFRKSFYFPFHKLEKKIPTSSQLVEWCNSSKYGLWIDRIHHKDNSILKKYKPSDFSNYGMSLLCKNAQWGLNKGKQSQLDLMTNAYYEKDCRNKEQKFQELLQQVRLKSIK